MKKLEYLKLVGSHGRKYAEELAALRIKVFYEFPYLYEGSLDYEKKYLETYFRAKNSLVILVKDLEENKIIGASTGIWAKEGEVEFSQPFIKAGMDPAEIFYFGESVLLNQYRGMGIGKTFFKIREEFAYSLGFIKKLAFCAVVRPESHPQKPQDYEPLNSFWESRDFFMVPNLKTTYNWLDRGDTIKTDKVMQFWMKNIEERSMTTNQTETKKLIENYYKAFNEKKVDKMVDLLSEDVIHDANQGGRTTSKKEFVSFMKDMDLYYDENLNNFSILVSPDGLRASAEFTCNGIYKKSSPGLPLARGQNYVLPVGCFFEIKTGKIARITNYYNLQDWLKQVQ